MLERHFYQTLTCSEKQQCKVIAFFHSREHIGHSIVRESLVG